MRIIFLSEVSGAGNPFLGIYGNYRKTIFLTQKNRTRISHNILYFR